MLNALEDVIVSVEIKDAINSKLQMYYTITYMAEFMVIAIA